MSIIGIEILLICDVMWYGVVYCTVCTEYTNAIKIKSNERLLTRVMFGERIETESSVRFVKI